MLRTLTVVDLRLLCIAVFVLHSHLILPLSQNVINQFTTLATAGRCHFIGGVSIGKDVQVKELLDAYSAVVLVNFHHLHF